VSAAVPVTIVICAVLWLNSARPLTLVTNGELPSSTLYVLADVLNEESSFHAIGRVGRVIVGRQRNSQRQRAACKMNVDRDWQIPLQILAVGCVRVPVNVAAAKRRALMKPNVPQKVGVEERADLHIIRGCVAGNGCRQAHEGAGARGECACGKAARGQ